MKWVSWRLVSSLVHGEALCVDLIVRVLFALDDLFYNLGRLLELVRQRALAQPQMAIVTR